MVHRVSGFADTGRVRCGLGGLWPFDDKGITARRGRTKGQKFLGRGDVALDRRHAIGTGIALVRGDKVTAQVR